MLEYKKMSELSSEYGSRKSISSIEPTLDNINELYEVGYYDGITIAVKNEINKYVEEYEEYEEEDYDECVNLAETDLLDNLIPLTFRATKEINVPFIEYIFSENIPRSIMKAIRRSFIETISENNNQDFISRIQKEIPDAVKIRYKDIDACLSWPYLSISDNNIEHLINSIDPTKYGNEWYGEELLDRLLSLNMQLSAISLAENGIKLTLEEIEALEIKYPDAYNTLENPIFRRESPQKTSNRSLSRSPVRSIPKSPVRSIPKSPVRSLPKLSVRSLPKSPVRSLPRSPVRSLPRSPVRSLPKLSVQRPTSIQTGSASSRIQNVLNPRTGRQIQVGGPAFRELQKEGYEYVNNKMTKR